MHTFKNHFLDSNVILGFILGEHKKYGKYFSLNFRKYASVNVYNECVDVLDHNKNWTIRFINIINKELVGKSSNNYKIELSLIIDRVTSPYTDHSVRLGKKVFNVLSSFSEVYAKELDLIIKELLDFKVFRKMITNSFKTSRNRLKCVFDKLVTMKNGHPSPMGDFFNQYQKLRSLGMHSSDFKLIADTYYISHNYIKTDLAFITFDGHIILLKEDIEEEFYIKVFKPT